ncbi:MAG: family 16 glycoside hydrolase [Balneolales bacterium]
MYACQPQDEQAPVATEAENISSLPFDELTLDNTDAFQTPGGNWQIAGGVLSDYQTENSMDIQNGTGTLVNLPTENERKNLFTTLEHGDIELKVEFLVPKGSNSGIYFQGRYEAQILDSWGVEEPQFLDVGGIYQRWDESRPDREKGFEGHAPSINTAKAPGLWQEYHILFRAPRFDDNGNKISNAKFEWIDLNGMRVQENVEVTGPTRAAAYEDEVASAPLMLQGDHGPVAFRNFRYKSFSLTDSLKLGEMEYTVYEHGGNRTPDFDTLDVVKKGVTDLFDPSELSPKDEHYAIWYSAEIEVPTAGDYLFQTQMSNGGELYVDGERIIPNTGEVDYQALGKIIHLSEGTHQLDLSFFQVRWGTNISLWYEGPGIEKRALGVEATETEERERPSPITVEPEAVPEIIGGFVNYGNEKRTHTLSVGHPEKVHYNYDLKRASVLNYWKGPFADATQMWRGRGESQLLVPMNAATEGSAGIPIVRLGSENAFDNHAMTDALTGLNYIINENGRPVFNFNYDGIAIQDEIYPSESGGNLLRNLRYEADETQSNIASRIAQGESIELLSKGLYRVNGQYYIQINDTNGQDVVIHDEGGVSALLVPILNNETRSEVQYQVIW